MTKFQTSVIDSCKIFGIGVAVFAATVLFMVVVNLVLPWPFL